MNHFKLAFYGNITLLEILTSRCWGCFCFMSFQILPPPPHPRWRIYTIIDDRAPYYAAAPLHHCQLPALALYPRGRGSCVALLRLSHAKGGLGARRLIFVGISLDRFAMCENRQDLSRPLYINLTTQTWYIGIPPTNSHTLGGGVIYYIYNS